MMAENRPDFLLGSQSADSVKNLFCISGYDKTKDEIIIKVVNTSDQPQKVAFRFKGIRLTSQTATLVTLTHADCTAENSRYNPNVVIPQQSQVSIGKVDIEREFTPWSFTVLRVKTTKLKFDKPTNY
jgi:alpha-L-arabinofuranosidase